MLDISGLCVSYGESRIINDLNMRIGENEIVAIVGRNGMGKTTLMKSLVGMHPSSAGSIRLGGQDLAPLQSYQRVRAGIGFVPQGRMIFSTMTVRENIETGLSASGEKHIPEHLYELFPVLRDMRSRRGGNLSGGQQQQLAIARALAGKPKVLLLDEPTEGIQPSIIHELARTLRRIRDEHGLSIIVSEQVLSFVLDVADRVLVMEKGALVHEAERAAIDEQVIAGFLSV